jgi:hypothetical protein
MIIDPSNKAGSLKRLKQKLDEHRAGWKETFRTNRRFYRGEQWTEDQKTRLKHANAEPLTLNDYFAAIRDKKGQVVRGKPTITAYPRDVNDVTIAQFYRDMISYILYANKYEMLEDLVVTDMMVGGLGWLECLWNPRLEDRQGDIEINYIDALSIYPDTESSLPDYSDGEFILKVLTLPTKRVRQLFPEHKNKIGPSHDDVDGIKLEDTGDYVQNFDASEMKYIRTERTELWELWYKEHGTWAVFQYLGPPTDELAHRQVLWHPVNSDRDLQELVETYDEQYEFYQVTDHRMKILTVANDQVLQDIYSEDVHNSFPFVPFVGIPTETAYPTSQGSQVQEVQKINNVLYSLMIAGLTSMNNPMTFVAKGLVDRDTIRKLEEQGGTPGLVVPVKPPIEAAVRREPGVGFDASIQIVMQQLDAKMERLFGVRGSLRGEREQGVKSGRMLQTLIQQAQVSIGPDALYISLARTALGKKIVSHIQQYYTPDRTIRIVGQDKAAQIQTVQSAPFDLKVGKFDIVVGDATSQPQNTMEEFLFLVELRNMGIPIDNRTLIESAPLSNKEVILERLQEQEQLLQQLGGQQPPPSS